MEGGVTVHVRGESNGEEWPMTTNGAQTAGNGGDATEAADANGAASEHAREIYELMLGLSNQVRAAYMEAYEKIACRIGDFQEKVAAAGLPDWRDAGGDSQTNRTPTSDVPEPLYKAAERALESSENLRQRSKKVTLASLNACEVAALALADWQEEVAATSPLDLVKTVRGARAELTRDVTKAYASTAREIVG
jgi:hypothetical protein